METKERSFIKRFLCPFVLTTIALVISSLISSPKVDYSVNIVSILRMFGCGFCCAYFYVSLKDVYKNKMFTAFVYLLFITSFACLYLSGIMIWQLALIYVI